MSYNDGMVNTGDPKLSMSTRILPAHYSWDNAWELVSDLPVEMQTSGGQIVATTNLSTEEYGIGDTVEEAIFDLVTSLSDYGGWLEDHEGRMGATETEDLKILRVLIRPITAK